MTDKQIITKSQMIMRIAELSANLIAKEQELQEAMDNYVKLDNQRVKEYNELVDKYKTKEQECERLRFPMSDTNYAILTKEEFEQLDLLKTKNEELKKIIDEAKNSKLDLKSFLVGEAVQKEYEEQLDQLKAENDSLKSELMQNNCYLDADKEIIDQLKAEQNIIKAVCENHFDEYEMGCLNLSEAIESLLERYDNAITRLMKDRKELKAENTKLKNNITSFNYLDSLTNEQVAVLYTASIDELAIRGYKAKYNTEVSLLTRYKQALTEIKEIAEKHAPRCAVSCPNDEYKCEICMLDDLKQILQKCEVLDEA